MIALKGWISVEGIYYVLFRGFEIASFYFQKPQHKRIKGFDVIYYWFNCIKTEFGYVFWCSDHDFEHYRTQNQIYIFLTFKGFDFFSWNFCCTQNVSNLAHMCKISTVYECEYLNKNKRKPVHDNVVHVKMKKIQKLRIWPLTLQQISGFQLGNLQNRDQHLEWHTKAQFWYSIANIMFWHQDPESERWRIFWK